jgi:hypothetical protein
MPVKGKIINHLDAETIYKKISDYDIYRSYIGHDFDLGYSFKSPLRDDDNNPSFSIIRKDNGKYHHFDYGRFQHSGDAIDFVQQKFLLNYTEALIKIDHDFGLGIASKKKDIKDIAESNIIESPRIFTPSSSLIIRSNPARKKYIVVTRKMNKEELDYWNMYHLSAEDLIKGEVFGVKAIYINRTKVGIRRTDLVFAYKFGKYWKIYFPNRSKDEKWMGNVPFDTISNIGSISPGEDKVIVAKAKKDELVISKFMPKVCSVQGESSYAINKTNLELLKTCPIRIICFDSDIAGIEASKYYNQFGFGWINPPRGYKDPKGKEIKDFSDLARYYGMEIVMAYFKRRGLLI